MIEKKLDANWSVSKPEHMSQEFWDKLSNDGRYLITEGMAQFELNTAATRDYAEVEEMSHAQAKAVREHHASLMAADDASRARQRRNRIAEGFAFALVERPQWHHPEEVALAAVKFADALILELDK